ncbi:MAG: hypothetical protein HZR80_10175 [Candidatus Heimdallarchaeota archaeon]
MKWSIIAVAFLSIGLIVLSSLGLALYHKLDSSKEQDFHYVVDFNCCNNNLAASIKIQIEGNNIVFKQILRIYCNADNKNFEITISYEGSTIIIREIFDDDIVARCICPIKIYGSINNVSSSFTALHFIFDNQYVNQVHTIETFNILI